MATYRCINCGEIKESENNRNCNCSKCGYRMFEEPYNREELLRKQIKDFLGKLKLETINPGKFTAYRKVHKGKNKTTGEDIFENIPKSKDDQRFPEFNKIQVHVCGSTKTEIFFERLTTSVAQIKKHISTPYCQRYRVSLKDIETQVGNLDAVLNAALKIADIELEMPKLELAELQLEYREEPDAETLGLASAILDDVLLLVDKTKKFIKQNNIYGTTYQRRPSNIYKQWSKPEYKDLQNCASRLSKVLGKRYVVDIFDDGTDELAEMLRAIWAALETVMAVPILEKKYTYTLEDGTVADGSQINGALLEKIGQRYSELDAIIYAYDFLAEKSDEELFELYDLMIGVDTYNYLGVNKAGLVRERKDTDSPANDEIPNAGESEEKLNALIGLSGIKSSIQKIKAYALANKDSEDLNIHMCFLGNPGSGKTEVARYIAGILYENKILPTKKVVEVDRGGLVSQYFGATAEKTRQVIASAMGGVLFVDEAYALGNNSDGAGITDYGKEAIDTLVKAMEDHRGKFCVIFAGYKNEMQKMIDINPGLKSRIQFMLDFPNYSREELQSITKLMLEHRKYTIADVAMRRLLDITDIRRKDSNFANAREIRNILDQVIMCQNMRCVGTADKELGLADVNQYIKDAKINLPTVGEGIEKKILTGEEELDSLIGLDSVKRMVKKIKAYAKRNKGEEGFNLHMCFYGNPGTGKTEVARILSRILHDAGVLDEAKLVETDGHGLMGKFVGDTAPKTKAKIESAMGGVLFIDEAYSLVGTNTVSGASNFGEEAIAVLLKEMEDRRGQFCTILAGYKDEMRSMIDANPGFESRIQFALDFPDYTREELGQIALAFLTKKKYTIDPAALELLLDVTEYYRGQKNFANARTIRNILDQVIMNQNLRTEDSGEDSLIIRSDVEDYIMDENIDLQKRAKQIGRIGFI